MRTLFVIIGLLIFGTNAYAQQQAIQVPTSQAQVILSFAPVVKSAAPAVVNIYTKRTEKVRAPVSPFVNDPFFQQFFGGNLGGGIPRERVVRSLGSGVIVNADGTIVTSHHVIKDADQITVVTSDKSEYEATFLKKDERSDLAVLKIKSDKPLPFLELRDSDTLEVGDIVLAIGNPFGVGQTVTQGIVSALARAAEGVSDYQFFIQTDAAINPGNSGGALVDGSGRLVGINTAIFSTSGGSNGIGFAIPANMVKTVLEGKASKEGAIIKPWIGIGTQALTAEMANSLGLAGPNGVIVQTVSDNSPASKAGVMVGDVITAIDGKPITGVQDLDFRLALAGVGKTLRMDVLRDGKPQPLDITPVGTDQAIRNMKIVLLEGNHPLGGIKVADLTPFMAEELRLDAKLKGVVVVENTRKPGSTLGQNLRTGDIILVVNGSEIENIAQLQQVLADRANGWQIVFKRGNMITTMVVR
jgi:Do/DeqQ family serine protease